MLKYQYKFLHGLKSNKFRYVLSKSYSEVHGNVVKLSEDPFVRELKVPFEHTSVVYFNQTDTLEKIIARIKSANEKVQKVDFYEFDGVKAVEETETLNILHKRPFEIRINNYHSIKYLPGINSIVNQSFIGFKDLQTRNSFNNLVSNTLLSKADKATVKNSVGGKLRELLGILGQYEEELIKTEDLIEKRHNRSQNNLLRLSILYFVLHFVVFYLLIYQFYGWDQIEPITYIVGNVYWIIAIGFFIRYKKKLDISYFISESFTESFFRKHSARFAYNKAGSKFTKEYISKLRQFEQAIDKL